MVHNRKTTPSKASEFSYSTSLKPLSNFRCINFLSIGQAMRLGIAGNFLTLIALASLVCCTVNFATAQLNNDAIVVTDFFEELYEINQGSAIDLLDSPTFEEVPGRNLAIANDSTAFISFNEDLYRFDFVTGQRTFVDELSFAPSEITFDRGGQLVAVGPGGLFRINPTTGAETSILEQTFFEPSDAVVDDTGNIFVTEHFDALGVVSPAGQFSQIGNFPPDHFSHVDLGPDGLLYLSTTVGASFYRVDPTNGNAIELDSGLFTFIRDLQVNAAGNIVFAGTVDNNYGVFNFDTSTRTLTTIVDDNTVNGGFFSPNDIAVYASDESIDPGVLNQNGQVDGGDLTQLLNAYGQSTAGDLDGDGDTDGSDVLEWQRLFTGSAGLATSIVPEPSTAILLLASLVCFARTRCRV